MGIIEKFKNLFFGGGKVTVTKMVTPLGNSFQLWGNEAYNNDTVRACVNARAKRISKLTLKHVRETTDDKGNKRLEVSPIPYMRFLLEKPNRYMTLSDFLFKLSAVSDLAGDAFALILRDENGLPMELYPIPANAAEARYNVDGTLYYIFSLNNGSRWQFSDADLIHIREDFYSDQAFGTGKAQALAPLLEVAETTDRGIINAIKNSSIVRWLLKYTSSMRPEDLKKNAKEFADNYLNIATDAVGVAATDAKADATQVNPQDYVPNASIMSKIPQRIMSLFGVNEKILQGTANEDEENAYYEAEIEPWVVRLAQEMTFKLFSRRQIGTGNYITAGSFNLQAASIKTKLQLVQMVDRGALTVNEWRETMGLPPVEGGETPIRRLDTATVETTPSGGGENNAESD